MRSPKVPTPRQSIVRGHFRSTMGRALFACSEMTSETSLPDLQWLRAVPELRIRPCDEREWSEKAV